MTENPKVVDSSVIGLHRTQMTSGFHGHSQKKGISPFVQKIEIKDVKGVSCANQCLSAPHV